MIQNIIFGNGGTFCPCLPFSDHFDKGTASRFLARMFIFVLVPINLNMSKVQRKNIFDHSSIDCGDCFGFVRQGSAPDEELHPLAGPTDDAEPRG